MAELLLPIKLIGGNEDDSKSAIDTLFSSVVTPCLSPSPISPEEFKVFPIIEKPGNAENAFAELKRFKRTNARYDKLPQIFIGFVNLSR